MTDILRKQKTDALAVELTEPAALLVRWIERESADWSQLPTFATNLDTLAEVFAKHRPEDQRTVEHEAVEVLWDFLSSFPDHSTPRRHKPCSTATVPGPRGVSHEESSRHSYRARP
ncbi:hypothetical protein [Streptomyces hyaluromycini]|uniref:hypothetical protein n=1 Tax=Streptomyces hyaluromycini TaxID=1377993 RepID=UPI000B5C64AF|nr:hypothetical protein [Streptomyces hyaluromycini]